MEYADSKRFLDQNGVLLTYLEKHQERKKTPLRDEHTNISIRDVSVILPFHNRIEYLPLTLSSVAQQGKGIEVVIVNDASSSSERNKLTKLVKDPRFYNLEIKIVDSKTPLGASNARNKGSVRCV